MSGDGQSYCVATSHHDVEQAIPDPFFIYRQDVVSRALAESQTTVNHTLSDLDQVLQHSPLSPLPLNTLLLLALLPRKGFLHNRLHPLRDDLNVRECMVALDLIQREERVQAPAQRDRDLDLLKRIRERAELALCRGTLGAELRLVWDGPRRAERVGRCAEQESGRGVEREPREEILDIDRLVRRGGRGEDVERVLRVLLEDVEVGNALFVEEGSDEGALLHSTVSHSFVSTYRQHCSGTYSSPLRTVPAKIAVSELR